MDLRKIITEQLLLEKKIAQIVTKMDVTFNFEFHKSSHAASRKIRPEQGIEYNQREISNQELRYFIDNFVKHLIAEKIIEGKINDNNPFIIKSLKWELAFPVYPRNGGGSYWIMNIGTLWRESKLNPFRVGKDQLVIEVE